MEIYIDPHTSFVSGGAGLELDNMLDVVYMEMFVIKLFPFLQPVSFTF